MYNITYGYKVYKISIYYLQGTTFHYDKLTKTSHLLLIGNLWTMYRKTGC